MPVRPWNLSAYCMKMHSLALACRSYAHNAGGRLMSFGRGNRRYAFLWGLPAGYQAKGPSALDPDSAAIGMQATVIFA